MAKPDLVEVTVTRPIASLTEVTVAPDDRSLAARAFAEAPLSARTTYDVLPVLALDLSPTADDVPAAETSAVADKLIAAVAASRRVLRMGSVPPSEGTGVGALTFATI